MTGSRLRRLALLSLVPGLALVTALVLPTRPAQPRDLPGFQSVLVDIGTGVQRTVAEWFTDRRNVRAYPGADLSAKFTAACASITDPQGGVIYIPAGSYVSHGPLRCEGKSIYVVGDGRGVSQVLFDNAAAGQAGIYLAPPDVTAQGGVRDLSLVTVVDQVNNNAAITFSYRVTPGHLYAGATFQGLAILGSANNSRYWGRGISLQNGYTSVFKDISITGKDVTGAGTFPATGAMDIGIEVDGHTGGCTGNSFDAVHITFARYGAKVSGDCEGLSFHDFVAGAGDVGILYPASKTWPSLFVSDSHFNTYSRGIVVRGMTTLQIHDSLFYKWEPSTQYWQGISLEAYADLSTGKSHQSLNNMIHHNYFFGYASNPASNITVGIATGTSDGNTIDHNVFVDMHYPFDLGGVPTTNTVTDNQAYNIKSTGGWQKNIGLNTVSRNNTPIAVGGDKVYVPFGVGATAANVGAWFQRVFYTNNPSAPATMTDFTNAEAGRQITIIAQDPNTTIANNSRIHLKGRTNMTMVPGASLTLLNMGTFWQEIGRSQ